MKTNPNPRRFLLLVFTILFTATATSALAMNEELVGVVVKTDQGVALSTNAGEYLILGKHLENFTGETVVVTGDVAVGALAKTIRVASVRRLNPADIIDPSVVAAPKHEG